MTTQNSRILNISVREGRMFVDRILLTCGLPAGYVQGVRDSVLFSQSLGLGGFQALVDGHSSLRMTAFDNIKINEDDGSTLSIDCAGMHAWLLAPTLTDLAVDIVRKKGSVTLKISNVRAVAEVSVIMELSKRYGARANVSLLPVDTLQQAAVMTFINASRPRTVDQADPLLSAALYDGYAVDESLWRSVYALSNSALAPDSVVSRRHAGPVILQDDGTLLGRAPSDDDFDVNMLRKVIAQPN